MYTDIHYTVKLYIFMGTDFHGFLKKKQTLFVGLMNLWIYSLCTYTCVTILPSTQMSVAHVNHKNEHKIHENLCPSKYNGFTVVG